MAVRIIWNPVALRRFSNEPEGEVAQGPLTEAGHIVVAGAKRRALRRTGRMAEGIDAQIVKVEGQLTLIVYSGATDPETGFPYPVVHEGKKVRDRRPHRSLVPALKDLAGRRL